VIDKLWNFGFIISDFGKVAVGLQAKSDPTAAIRQVTLRLKPDENEFGACLQIRNPQSEIRNCRGW